MVNFNITITNNYRGHDKSVKMLSDLIQKNVK
jgi:hypothetical protein